MSYIASMHNLTQFLINEREMTDSCQYLLLFMVFFAFLFLVNYMSNKEYAANEKKKSKEKIIVATCITLILSGIYGSYYFNKEVKRVEEVRKQQVIEARENFRNRYTGEDRDAREKSFISRDTIVSPTGKKYYHGVECNDDCLTLKANYDKDKSEDELALDESFGKIVVSETGKKYYRGVECEGDCLGYKTGYRWANELGITSEAFCDEKSETEAFRAGCLDGVENVILDLRAYIQAEYPEDCE